MAGRMHGLVAKDERPMAAVKSMVATSSIQCAPVRPPRTRRRVDECDLKLSRFLYSHSTTAGLHALASATHGQLRASLALLALRG